MTTLSFFNTYWFDAAIVDLWDDRATLERWCQVEIALARVEAELGIIPEAAAARIAEVAVVGNFDLGALARAIAVAQHPLVPVLTAIEDLAGPEAGGWLHWGATTQNIFDTAQALQMKESVSHSIAKLTAVCARLRALADRHRQTVQAGRTHGQHALPITFGLKAAGWLAEMKRHLSRLTRLQRDAFVVRISGAVGTYAALEGRGHAVERRLASVLGLTMPELSGRTDFDRQGEIMTTLAAAAACCERIAADLLFLQRTEIAEVAEFHYADRIGSSTMAQKRNPSEAQRVIALARLTRGRIPMVLESMVRDDEGDASVTNVTDLLIPDFCILAVSTFSAAERLLDHITVDEKRMRDNAGLTDGAICAEAVMMQLGKVVGRGKAHHILHAATMRAAEKTTSFADELRADPEIMALRGQIDIDALLDPSRYLGEIDEIISRVS